MDTNLLAVTTLVVVALIFDYINGFHDAANSIATVVSTRVLTPGKAVIWAAFFNFVAAFTFGTAVAKTVGSGLVDISVVTFAVIFAGLVGAIVWDLITWYYGLPTSSSHALIGGYAGAAVMKAGWGAIIASGWTKTLIFIVLAPMIGMVLVLGTSFGGLNLMGVLLALGAGVIYSTYIFIGNRLIREIPPLVTTAFVTLFTACTLLISGLATGQIDFHIELQSWIACATLAFFSTILSIFLQLKGLEWIGTTRTSVLSLFEPIVAIILSALFLHDALTFTQLIGSLIVVTGGVLVVAIRDKNKEQPPIENAA